MQQGLLNALLNSEELLVTLHIDEFQYAISATKEVVRNSPAAGGYEDGDRESREGRIWHNSMWWMDVSRLNLVAFNVTREREYIGEKANTRSHGVCSL
jgi:hypothetical protein